MDEKKRTRRRRRIRARVIGSTKKPRASIWRGTNSISVQLIDDSKGETLLAVKKVGGEGGKVRVAEVLGKEVGEKAIEKGIKQVVFDRGGYVYHGRVKAVAEGMRQAGLKL